MTAALKSQAAVSLSGDSNAPEDTNALESTPRPWLKDSNSATERRLVQQRPLRVYVASSIRNERFAEIVQALQAAGHDVYNFREQPTLFPWTAVVGDPPCCALEDQRQALLHSHAEQAFRADMGALIAADACVLALPAGASSHFEAGFAVGAGKRVVILLADQAEPELMNKMATTLCTSIEEVVDALTPHSSSRLE